MEKESLKRDCDICFKTFITNIPNKKRCSKECTKTYLKLYRIKKYKTEEYKNYVKEYRETHRNEARKQYYEKRLKALSIIGNGVIECSNCGCTEVSIIEINHLNGIKNRETLPTFLGKIINKKIDVNELNLLCKPCNDWYEVVRKHPKIAEGYKISWRPPRLLTESKRDFDIWNLIPKFSALSGRSEVDVTTKITEKIDLKIPIISSPMMAVTEYDMIYAMNNLGGAGAVHRYMKIEEQKEIIRAAKSNGVYPTIAAINVNDWDRTIEMINVGADILLLDIANGDMKSAYETTKKVKREGGIIVSGNIVTGSAAEKYYSCGIDALRVGVGIGSACSTRSIAGVGRNQIISIKEIANMVPNVPIWSDGGIRHGSDILKALAAGADTVIIGSLLSPATESPAERINYASRKYVKYFGMASKEAMIARAKKMGYEENLDHVKAPEGESFLIIDKGQAAKDIVDDIIAELRHGMAYLGAKNIPELWKKAVWEKI